MSESAWGEGSAAATLDDVDESWPHDEERTVSDAAPSSFPLYPVALKLAGRLAVVVGGGAVAQRKTSDLLRAGARVWAIAPEWRADFSELEADPATGGRLLQITRGFTAGDLVGAFLVVAATDDVATQRAVARAAEAQGILCNVVDVNDLCSFYVPATLRRGGLAIAVQTDGRFPLLAVALRDRLARVVGPGFAPALETLAQARDEVRRLYPQDAARRLQALRALFGDDALELLLAERFEEFEARVNDWRRGLAS
jgi:precorrin-2 dehydrogenase